MSWDFDENSFTIDLVNKQAVEIDVYKAADDDYLS